MAKRGVAFYGEPGAGKSTARDYVLATFGASFVPFAGPLRQEIVRALCGCMNAGCSEEVRMLKQSYDPETKAAYIPLLQAWGAFRRHQHPDYWVEKACSAIYIAANPFVVNDDLRYNNERKMLVEIDVVPIWIDGPIRSKKPMDHESERDWKTWVEADMEWGNYVRNYDSLPEYIRKLDAVVRRVLMETGERGRLVG